MLAVRSLQQRQLIFLLLPVTVSLLAMGFAGFIFARTVLLRQWEEAALLKLERAAHFIEMRLSRPVQLLQLFNKTGPMGSHQGHRSWILREIEALEGVTRFELKWDAAAGPTERGPGGTMAMMSSDGMRFHRGRIVRLTLPAFNPGVGQETVSLISTMQDATGTGVGHLAVDIRFDYLMDDVRKLGWWQSESAFLVDADYRILTGTDNRRMLGETGDDLERRIRDVIQDRPHGTLLGPGHPPDRVAGFYRIESAGWWIVLIAPGGEILAPIIRFRNYFFAGVALMVGVVLLLIRAMTGQVVDAIREISRAAGRVARGHYEEVTPPRSQDEIADLVKDFNTMVDGLKERDFIANTFGRYVDHEIARQILARPEAVRLGGERRKVAILMSDIRNFTPLAETLSPESTLGLLNHYFAHMITIISRYKGIVVDFFGDALLVFFDPLDGPVTPAAHRAVTCALALQDEMPRFNKEHAESGRPVFQMGIGLHCGEVVVGNIGTESRAKYGIVGAAVNLTHRIQALAGEGEVVASESIRAVLHDCLEIERRFDTTVKGVSGSLQLVVIRSCRTPTPAETDE